jgi:hypothetical protein
MHSSTRYTVLSSMHSEAALLPLTGTVCPPVHAHTHSVISPLSCIILHIITHCMHPTLASLCHVACLQLNHFLSEVSARYDLVLDFSPRGLPAVKNGKAWAHVYIVSTTAVSQLTAVQV